MSRVPGRRFRLGRRGILLAGSLALLQGCASLSSSIVRVEADDSTRPVELRTGQLLEIRLLSYPGVSRTLSLGSDVAPVLIGGLLIGGAATIAGWFVGDWQAADHAGVANAC